MLSILSVGFNYTNFELEKSSLTTGKGTNYTTLFMLL